MPLSPRSDLESPNILTPPAIVLHSSSSKRSPSDRDSLSPSAIFTPTAVREQPRRPSISYECNCPCVREKLDRQPECAWVLLIFSFIFTILGVVLITSNEMTLR
eukprot:UN04453